MFVPHFLFQLIKIVPSSTTSSLPVGGIVGGAVGGVIAIALIFAVAWYMVTKNRRGPVGQTPVNGQNITMQQDYSSPRNKFTESEYMVRPTTTDEAREMPGNSLRYPDDLVSGNLASDRNGSV